MQRKRVLFGQKIFNFVLLRGVKAANNRIHLVLRVVGIVKGLNELALSCGYHLWLHTDFSLMTINTLIEIMNLSFRWSKQTSASQENFLAKVHSRARGICHVQ